MNLRVINGTGSDGRPVTVAVTDGRIAVEAGAGSAGAVVDAAGRMILPGLIDMHVHYRDPWRDQATPAGETIASGLAAALNGGVTGSACMPNTAPALDTPDLVRYVIAQGAAAGPGRVWPVAAITRGRQGTELADLPALRAAGAVAFSDDGAWLADARLMEQALAASRDLGVPVITHAHDEKAWPGWVLHDGAAARRLKVPGIPSRAEAEMVARDIDIARRTRGRLHVAHVSAGASLAHIRRAKAEGLAVTCEVTPQHLVLCEDDIPGPDPNYKLAPPLRTAADREALRAALADGTIDVIASDHAPHPPQRKQGFAAAANGVTGVETMLFAVWHALVAPGIVPAARVVDALAARPAAILGVAAGRLDPGASADLILFDPAPVWACTPAFFRSQSRNSPFAGRMLQGRIHAIYIAGRAVQRRIAAG
ncbi:MAG: dihydroorotase [Planctomycetota bacterium]